MKLMHRTMTVIEQDANKFHFNKSQASYNSDGRLTLRNYHWEDKNSDEIILFSRQETEAILNLFVRLEEEKGLPF